MLTSCAYMFKEAVAPNRCMKCALVDVNTNETLWSEDECGGGSAGMEKRCKVEAYDYFVKSRQVRCDCESYKAEEATTTSE